MATASHRPLNRSQIVSTVATEETADARVPIRRVLGSTGISIVVHLVALLALSLIVMAQQDSSPIPQISGDFSELVGDGNAALDLSEPDILEIETTLLNLPDVTDLITPNAGAVAEANINLAAFASNDQAASGAGLAASTAAIASGIQGRVVKAGGRSGEVQFSLAWQSLNDLDLHVIVPSGEHISFSHRTSKCKGDLDIDMNAETAGNEQGQTFSAEPVENVRWLERTAPSGRYTVIVNQYRWRGRQRKDPFQLLVKLGEDTQIVQDEVSAWKSISVHRFRYAKSSLPKARREKLDQELVTLQKREEEQALELYQAAYDLPKNTDRDRKMMNVIIRFPHTDASILAMQELTPVQKK